MGEDFRVTRSLSAADVARFVAATGTHAPVYDASIMAAQGRKPFVPETLLMMVAVDAALCSYPYSEHPQNLPNHILAYISRQVLADETVEFTGTSISPSPVAVTLTANAGGADALAFNGRLSKILYTRPESITPFFNDGKYVPLSGQNINLPDLEKKVRTEVFRDMLGNPSMGWIEGKKGPVRVPRTTQISECVQQNDYLAVVRDGKVETDDPWWYNNGKQSQSIATMSFAIAAAPKVILEGMLRLPGRVASDFTDKLTRGHHVTYKAFEIFFPVNWAAGTPENTLEFTVNAEKRSEQGFMIEVEARCIDPPSERSFGNLAYRMRAAAFLVL